ncbi:hypothetical protein N665_0809s0053 [Sinapis alba]|nr:hypothetical protein N665_0809s0053 [Sinapis alba]
MERRDSDSNNARRLQTEETLSSRSRTPQQQPSVPTSGLATAVENGRNSSAPRGLSRNARRRNSRRKGKITHEAVTGERNPNAKVGNFRNEYVYVAKRPSPSVVTTVGEGSSTVNAAAGKFSGDVLYRLYFKGLVSEESVTGKGKGKMADVAAGFGVAICDQRDGLLFELKGELLGRDTNRQGAEIKALTRGLTEASKLGIKHVAMFCDSYPIFQYVKGNWVPKQKKISVLMDDLQRIRQQFSFSQAVLVAGNEVKFAYKLARESIVSQANPCGVARQAKVAWKEECLICYKDIDLERMFSVGKCRHRFCFHCVKQHVEVKLLHGMVPNCPHDGCKSEVVMDACRKLLTPKLSEMWKQRIKDYAIPVAERVYCPYPRCLALMSRTKITESAKSLLSVYPASGVRRCVECRGLFCVDCKVQWHGKVSCTEYKNLHPNPPADDVKLSSLANNKTWNQCEKCQHIIELTQGCNHITCRCGYEFCYNCGGEWNKETGTCAKHCPTLDEAFLTRQDPAHVYAGLNKYYDDDDEDYEDYEEEDEDFDYGFGDFPFGFGQNMNDANSEESFDPFSELPAGVPRSHQMLAYKALHDMLNPGEEFASEDCPYFGKFGKYATFYDSDGYEYDDYTNPFHPDYD